MRTIIRILLGVVLGFVFIVIPLFVVHRADCRQGKTFEEEWTVAVPFRAERERGCRSPQSGAQLILGLARGE